MSMHELLSTMSNRDIQEIILDKTKELKEYPVYKEHITITANDGTKDDLFWKNYIVHTDEVSVIKSTINILKWELKAREQERIGKWRINIPALRAIPIRDVIASCVNLYNYSPGRNIKCPFKWHEEKTPSFHIYETTNTCHCFWCGMWGSTIDFIMNFYGIETKAAIELLAKF